MSIMYEAVWHAIIVGPVLILIALLDVLTALVETCSDQFDRFAGEVDFTSGVNSSHLALQDESHVSCDQFRKTATDTISRLNTQFSDHAAPSSRGAR